MTFCKKIDRDNQYWMKVTLSAKPANLCSIVCAYIVSWWQRHPTISLTIYNDKEPWRIVSEASAEPTSQSQNTRSAETSRRNST